MELSQYVLRNKQKRLRHRLDSLRTFLALWLVDESQWSVISWLRPKDICSTARRRKTDTARRRINGADQSLISNDPLFAGVTRSFVAQRDVSLLVLPRCLQTHSTSCWLCYSVYEHTSTCYSKHLRTRSLASNTAEKIDKMKPRYYTSN